MKMLRGSFIFSNVNHCLLVWSFRSVALSQEIEKTQERALSLSFNDNYTSYNSLLLKPKRPTMEMSR